MRPGVDVTPAEKELYKAKESLSLLNQLASQAERGSAIEFQKALDVLLETSHAMQHLARGKIPSEEMVDASCRDPLTNSTNQHSGSANQAGGISSLAMRSSSSTRGAYVGLSKLTSSTAVTELQRRRAEQVLSELQLLDGFLRRQRRKLEQQQQHVFNMEQLLGNTQGAREDESISYDDLTHLGKEEKGLKYARRHIQHMQMESQAVLTALQQQSRRLGGVGNKMADMMESIGVSNTTILQIVRRNQLDAWLVYGGIIALIILMWYIL
ncbi:unnamed protein product [Phytomonas sp. EM1]|nr:unnamed protein product [Phytomonas sp. EM1]|eukprot:CCW64682.1 unnamed protein product [Phytomonas sp. isolate EM1]